ncbi:hypothetical protein SAMN05421858_4277 [Haladaptatus litoreus]|uniref:Uncharacterized protein n=1 Tax=Haladaptatus litoreus TaxID=553468 RepID=A0A1N7EIP1_9EURY|nr:hypothetical protein [Haladaptatus litoreus]SIR87825.1 hypothetical protein SAMN05421858_4277 [Haladaptatus litoreus]
MSDRNKPRDGRKERSVRDVGAEWDEWTHPAISHGDEHERPGEDDGTSDNRTSGYVSWKSPPSERSRTPREAVRTRLNLTDRQWYVVETLLLFAPYPLFVIVYINIQIDGAVFLVSTLLYSLFAMYVGIFS